ncbi:hypothetical protein GYM62_14860 [Algoriphagus sp. NBT04N3]|jgi:hypothetical protein|uniref:hypothetical protein n=1 Tax=Algoriphagus sp. NBT04N3 TaxID=2705473 RepID=UPI001C638553|nr:hypothetical protein [Algoriphagus sp. NBT04N3]QYH40005.1 hypothetical protein GYM62_14860 [Algoriphagus sp. NBT04N3]
MTKKQLIDQINTQFKGNLNTDNTCFASINKSKRVWWANIPVSKFADEVHLLLADTDHFLWISLPKGFVRDLASTFRIREDKNAVDLEISADKNTRYLADVKSGGTGFDFRRYVKEEIRY